MHTAEEIANNHPYLHRPPPPRHFTAATEAPRERKRMISFGFLARLLRPARFTAAAVSDDF